MEAEGYIDTKVIELRRKQDQANYNNIETGIYVNNQLIEFEVQELFDKKMSIALPKGMMPMAEDMAKIKYTTENRPKIIYTNQEGTVNFTFNHFTLPIQDEETIQAVQQIKNLFKKIHPANIFYEMKEEAIDKTKLSWFDFKGYAIDSQLYHLIYVTPIEKTMLNGAFNCPFADAAEWKKAVLPVILSIKDLTAEKGAERS